MKKQKAEVIEEIDRMFNELMSDITKDIVTLRKKKR